MKVKDPFMQAAVDKYGWHGALKRCVELKIPLNACYFMCFGKMPNFWWHCPLAYNERTDPNDFKAS